jgi:rod shape-determining protein MreD
VKLNSYSLISLTLVLGFICNLFPWGNTAWVPDFLLVVLAFWIMQTPEKINITSAFFLGLLMDIQTSQYLGIHAITYVITCFLIIYWDRRLKNNTLLGQTVVMLQIFLIANFFQLIVLWGMGTFREFAFSYLFIPSILEMCLWPLLKKLLSSNSPHLNQNHS